MKNMGFEKEDYTGAGPGRPAEITETILRYDTNKTYYLRG
jgi:hypothetical protein